MNILIITLDSLTAIAAFMAGYLWLKASKAGPGIAVVDAADGYHDEFITLKHSLKNQCRLNAKGALYSCIAAVLQGIVFVASIFK